jgi:hypothetical protein
MSWREQVEDAGDFVLQLVPLALGLGANHDASAGEDMSFSSQPEHRADRDGEFGFIAGNESQRARIPTTVERFVLFNESGRFVAR